MLTLDEAHAWNTYVSEMHEKGVTVDLRMLIETLRGLEASVPGQVIAAALGVGTCPHHPLTKEL